MLSTSRSNQHRSDLVLGGGGGGKRYDAVCAASCLRRRVRAVCAASYRAVCAVSWRAVCAVSWRAVWAMSCPAVGLLHHLGRVVLSVPRPCRLRHVMSCGLRRVRVASRCTVCAVSVSVRSARSVSRPSGSRRSVRSAPRLVVRSAPHRVRAVCAASCHAVGLSHSLCPVVVSAPRLCGLCGVRTVGVARCPCCIVPSVALRSSCIAQFALCPCCVPSRAHSAQRTAQYIRHGAHPRSAAHRTARSAAYSATYSAVQHTPQRRTPRSSEQPAAQNTPQRRTLHTLQSSTVQHTPAAQHTPQSRSTYSAVYRTPCARQSYMETFIVHPSPHTACLAVTRLPPSCVAAGAAACPAPRPP